jgi:hypothetical protein
VKKMFEFRRTSFLILSRDDLIYFNLLIAKFFASIHTDINSFIKYIFLFVKRTTKSMPDQKLPMRLGRLLGHLQSTTVMPSRRNFVSEQSPNELVKRADEFESQNRAAEALPLLKRALDIIRGEDSITQAQILWRVARCHKRLWDICKQKNDEGGRKKHLRDGLLAVEEGLRILSASSQTCGELHKYASVMLATQAEEEGVKAKAKLAQRIVFHSNEALKLCKTDSSVHHMAGRLALAFAGASWIEKKALEVVGYPLPSATFADAIKHFRTVFVSH